MAAEPRFNVKWCWRHRCLSDSRASIFPSPLFDELPRLDGTCLRAALAAAPSFVKKSLERWLMGQSLPPQANSRTSTSPPSKVSTMAWHAPPSRTRVP